LVANVLLAQQLTKSRSTQALKYVSIVCAVALITTTSAKSAASDRQTIRFYKINKDGITQALRFTKKKAAKSGCHDFIRKARLHRAVQFKYKTCHIYANKSCDIDSIVSFYRDKDATPTTELLQGFGWLPVGEHERGVRVKSWFCE
jgi:hypothetical protein